MAARFRVTGMAQAAVDVLDAQLARFPPVSAEGWRPSVTLAYAQSLDGCIAAARGTPTRLSGDESMRLTHALRARHDGILVGVGTVLADNPQLSNRLEPGSSPRPVVLDARLRTPPTARLLCALGGAERGALVLCDADELSAAEGASGRASALRKAGAVLVPLRRRATRTDATVRGPSLELRAVLEALSTFSMRSVMVEGGCEVLRSFLAAGHVDELCVTTAPVLLADGPRFGSDDSGVAARASEPGGEAGGARARGEVSKPRRLPLARIFYAQAGQDMVLFASVAAPAE